ncbi:HD domain-containing phosphohydrolase [Erythrobacter sp. SG61-1L]|uniref:HD-GYP domain-containing protein n=1 Tax=Erythrobacter sp. SG61-1L TaxID=1603897 RepID=UPI0006C919A0|nr:HD domain-containing phosphohydrolase [Erythrobacter sp. SG61-1L]
MLHEDLLRRRPAHAGVSLAEVIRAFAHALDLAEGQPEGHSTRACYFGCLLGHEIGLDAGQMGDLFFTLLLKDLGCSSNAARIWEHYRADDLRFKQDAKTLPAGLSANLGFVLRKSAEGAPFSRRVGVIASVLRHGDSFAQEMALARAGRGASLAAQLGFSPAICSGIYHLDEHWDGSGRPSHLSGEAIPLNARIAQIAQLADVFYIHGGPEAAMDEVAARAGNWLDPHLAATFQTIAERAESWVDLGSPWLVSKLLALAPEAAGEELDEDGLDRIAGVFGQVIDAKSPYTAGHSVRVADLADRLAQRLGVISARRRPLRRAAALHDIGKLGVPNAILDKPGGLDEAEWRAMRGHAAQTKAILGRITAFSDMAALAAAHHERLDGTGYPLGLEDAAIARETRIITVCDIYDALTSPRPQRPAMSRAEALEVMQAEVGQAIDGEVFEALKALV